MFRKVNGVVEVAIFVYRILGDVPEVLSTQILTDLLIQAPAAHMVFGLVVIARMPNSL